MSGVPYRTTARPDTRLTNAELGMLLFLLSEVMFFGALFSAYMLLSTIADGWGELRAHIPHGVRVVMPLFIGAALATRYFGDSPVRSRLVPIALALLGLFVGYGGVAMPHAKVALTGNAATSTLHASYYLINGAIGIHALLLAAVAAAILLWVLVRRPASDAIAVVGRCQAMAWGGLLVAAVLAEVLFVVY